MNNEKIINKIPVEDQYDVELHGCSDDCLDYYGNTRYEANIIASQGGINTIDPTQSEIVSGNKFASDMGISYCYGSHNPNTSIYL